MSTRQRRQLFFEALEDRRVLSAMPLVTLDVPQATFIGTQDLVIRATFENTATPGGLNDIGYGPFIDLVFPVNGADGDPEDPAEIKDGISPVSGATYLGLPVTTTQLIFPNDGSGVGCVLHPYAVDNDGPLQVCGPTGDILVVVQLPFGSFTPEQPPVTIELQAELSNFADLGVGLPIVARGGFQFGVDPLNNPSTDPTILTSGSDGSDSSTWTEVAEVIPTVMTMTKTYIGPEDETATGPNFPRQYELVVNIAPGQTIDNLQIIDGFDNNIVVTGITVTTTHTPSPINIPAVPFGPAEFDFDDDEQLVAEIPEVEGTGGDDVIVMIDFYVPEFNANIIDSDTGERERIIPIEGNHGVATAFTYNDARARGDWDPLDPRDEGGVGNAIAEPDFFAPDHILDNKSIAIQKSVAVIGGGTVRPGVQLEYTLSFQISDYYTFGDLVITDTFSDGQNFLDDDGNPVFTPYFTVSDRTGTTGGEFALDTTFFHTFDYDPLGPQPPATETLVFDLSEALRLLSVPGVHDDGILIGGLATAEDDFGAPPETVGLEAPAIGTVTFAVFIPNDYVVEQPAGNQYLAQGDTLTNDAWIVGSVRNNEDPTVVLNEEQGDDTGASVSIEVGNLHKSIYAVNGVVIAPDALPADFRLAPGDELTFCLVYTKPITSFNNVLLRDWLPLPVFDVMDPLADGSNEAWQFNEDSKTPGQRSTPPVAGYFQIGPLDTLYDKTGGATGPDFFNPPEITPDGTGNSLMFNYGSYDSDENTEETLHILFTITASDRPFADGLFLTNIVRAFEDNSQLTTSIEDAIVQFPLGQPALNISKGVVATDYPENGGTFEPVFVPSTVGPVTFHSPGASPSFTGIINSDGLAASPINSNLQNIDAGNLVTFAIVVENTGSSRKGAFDIQVQDTLPDGFAIPGAGDLAGLNLSVTDGTGDDIDWVRVATSDTLEMALFGAGIQLVNPGPTLAQPDGTDAGALDQYDATSGRNILVITYDLIALDVVEPNQLLENTATLLAYAGAEDGPNHIAPSDQPTDDAQVTIASPQIEKSIVDTNQTHTTLPDVAIGEIITYQVEITVPEGTMSNARLVDVLDSGLAFVEMVSITASDDVSTSISGGFNAIADNVTVTNVGNGGVNQGRQIELDFGTITNSNTVDTVTETIVVTYNVVVLNSENNIRGEERNNQAQWQWEPDFGPQSIQDSASNVVIVEPTLEVEKTADPEDGEAGDVITFTIVVQHSDDSNADAFEVTLTDEIPTGMTYVDGSLAHTLGVVPNVLEESSGTITAIWDSLAVEARSTFVFQVTLDVSVVPGQEIVNSADIFYSSLPGDVSNPQSVHNDLSTERTGDPDIGGSTASYRDDDDAPVTIFTPIAVDKSVVATSEPHTEGSNVAIGEIVRYRLVTTIIRGTNPAYRIVDTLPEGLRLIDYGEGDDPNLVTVQFDSTNPITSPDTELEPWDLAGANDVAISMPLDRIDVSGQKVTFDFGTLVNDNSGEGLETVILEFNALVLNTAGNQRGTTLSNSFELFVGVDAEEPIQTSPVVNVTIVEPELVVTKEADVNTGDAFDTITFTITVQHSDVSDADAFNVELTDVIPVGMNFVDGSLLWVSGAGTGLSFSETEQTITAEWASLLQDAVSKFEFQVILDLSVVPGQVLTNTADMIYTSLPGDGSPGNPTGSITPGDSGDEDGQRDGSGGVNDYADSDSQEVTIIDPGFTKTLLATSQTTPLQVATIGEILTYQIVITVPEGTMPNAIVVDAPAPGLAIVAIDSLVVSDPSALTTSIVGGFSQVLSNANASIPAGGATSDGSSVTFDFGTLTNTDTDIDVAETITIEYRAVVLNAAANVRGVALDNDATLNWSVDNGPRELEAAAEPVTIVEPILSIVKQQVDPALREAQNEVTFEIVVQHGLDSNADAFDVQLVDLIDSLPNKMRYVPGTLVVVNAGFLPDLVTSANDTNGDPTITWDHWPRGATSTITFDVVLDIAVTPEESLTNTADLTWTSLPGDITTPQTTNPNSVERTGNPLDPGELNNYAASDDGIVTIQSLTPTKTIVATSEPDTVGNAVAIGEIVRYRLQTTLIQGTHTNLQLVDTLPEGLMFLDSDQVKVSFVSDADMTVDSDLAGANNSDDPPTFVLPSGRIASQGQILTFNLGTVVNNDNDTDLEYVILEFNVLVTNTDSVQNGVELSNELKVFVDGTQFGQPQSAQVSVVEPSITNAVKIATSDPPLDAFDPVTYEVRFSNTGSATAFDVRLLDILDPSLFFSVSVDSIDLGLGAAGATNNTSGTTVNVTIDSIPVDGTVVVTYTGILSVNVQPSQTIPNLANVTYTSLPGSGTPLGPDNPTGSVTPGGSGDADGERDGSGGVNNYTDSDSHEVILTNLPEFTKTLVGSSQSYTVDSDLTIGEVAVYQLVLTVPEGTMPNVSISDIMPSGMQFLAVDSITSSDPDALSFTSFLLTTSSTGFTLQLGTVVNTNTDNDVTETVTIVYRAVVLDVPENVSGQQRTNAASFQWTRGEIDDAVTIEIVEPDLEIIKEANVSRVDRGDTVTFTITVSHTDDSTAAAQGVTITDVLPTGLSYVGNLTSITGPQPTATVVGQTLSFRWTAIPLDADPYVFSFDVTVEASIPLGKDLLNTAQLVWSTLPGTDLPNDRSYGDGDEAQLTVNSNALTGVIYVDLNDNGLYEPGAGESLITERVVLQLTGTDHLGNPVDRVLITSTGTYAFENLPPSDATGYTITQINQPTGYVDGRDTPGTVFGGTGTAGGDPRDADAITGIVIPAGSNATGENYNFGELPPASIGDFVWVDLNGNGLQDPGEPGLAGVTVELSGTDSAGNPITRQTSTDGSGFYEFADLRPGAYVVTFQSPAGYVFTQQDADDAGLEGENNSDADPTSGETAVVTLAPGDNVNYVDAGLYQPASIGDFVWEDLDGDGLQDPGEPGLEGVTVTLTGTDGAGNAVSLTTTTDADGFYWFDNLAPGSYMVTFGTPTDYVFTAQDADGQGITGGANSDADRVTGATAPVTVASGDTVDYVDAGLYRLASIGDFVWDDLNGDGIQDAGEPGLANVTVTLTGIDGTGDAVSLTTTTDTDGFYLFDNLAPGSYTLTFGTPTDYVFTAQDADGQGITGGANSDANPLTGATAPVTVVSGDDIDYVDAGLYQPVSIGDFVWVDLNEDGIQDEGEPGLNGVVVILRDADGNPVDVTFTKNDPVGGEPGFYEFTSLPPGTYSVQMVLPGGYFFSPQNTDGAGLDGPLNSDVDPTTGETPQFTLQSGDAVDYVDAGLIPEAPSIQLVKTQIGGPHLVTAEDIGVELQYQIVVTNTGNINQTGVAVIDILPDGTEGTLVGPEESITVDGILQVGETWTYTVTYTVTAADIQSGSTLINTARVTTDQVPCVTEDQANTEVATLTIAKTQTDGPNPVTAAGQELVYTIVVTNTGSIDQTDVVVTDTLPDGTEGTLIGPEESEDPDGILQVGETWTYTVRYTVTQDDINNASTLVNTASVTTEQIPGPTEASMATELALLTIAKTQTGGPNEVTEAGEELVYTIVVTNTGSMDQTGVVVTDTLPDGTLVTLSDPEESITDDGILQVGETWTYIVRYTVTQADLDAGQDLVNTATVMTSQLPCGTTDDASTPVDQAPSLTITKTQTNGPDSVDEAGQELEYEIVITNTGNISLTSVVLLDTLPDGATIVLGDPDESIEENGILDVGETWTYTVTYTVTQADLDAGNDLINTARVFTAQVPGPTTDETSTPVQQDPSLEVIKAQINSDEVPLVTAAGQLLQYQITVINTGNVSLTGVTVTDTLPDNRVAAVLGPFDTDGNLIIAGSLQVDEQWFYSIDYVVTQDDVDAGQDLINTVQVVTVEGAEGTDNAITEVDQQPGIALVKMGEFQDENGNGWADVGETIAYTFTVTNTGNVTLTDVTLTDAVAGVTIDGGPIALLAPGESDSTTFTATYTITQTDIDAGSFFNEATITGRDPNGDEITGDGDDRQPLPQNPAIDIEKATNGQDADQPTGPHIVKGFPVVWTYVVTNTGNVTLTDVVVSDDQLGEVGRIDLLAPGASQTLTADGTAIEGQYANIGTATGRPPIGDRISDSDPSHYLGLARARLGNFVWHDLNADGLQDPDESGVAGVTVTLIGGGADGVIGTDDDTVETTMTDADGFYSFTGLIPGIEYQVVFSLPDGYVSFTTPRAGSDDMGDSDADPETGAAPILTLAPDEFNDTIDAGLLQAASIGDRVWVDLNGDGIQDEDEPGLPGVTVNLTGTDVLGNAVSLSTTTEEDGLYQFDDLVPGTYSVRFVAPDGYVFTVQDADETGITGEFNSDADPQTGETEPVTVFSGDAVTYVDAGLKVVADLQITKTAEMTSAVPGSLVTYTIVVTNAGPGDVTGAQVIDDFSPLLVDVNYTSSVTGTVSGNTLVGVGDINDTVDMTAGSTITYQVSAVLSMNATGVLGNVAGVIPPTGIEDPNLANNVDCVGIPIEKLIVISPDKTNGSRPWIHVVTLETGQLVTRFQAFEEDYWGGVRVATGDLTGDGVPEIVAVRGRNSTPDVRIFDLAGNLLHQVQVFSENFRGGVDIAVGDVNGDGRNDLIAGMSYQGSQVVVFRNITEPGSPLMFEQDKSFYPFGQSFIGGVVLAVADMGELQGALFHPTLDGTAEIIVGNEAGMRPTVKVFDYGTLQAVRTFHPFHPSFMGGLSLDVARVNGDLIPDIIVGTGLMGGSNVEVLDGNVPTKSTILSFVAYSQYETPSFNVSVRVAGVDTNGDGWADVIVTGQGTNGTTGTIKVFQATAPATLIGQFPGNQPAPSDFASAYFVADLRTARFTPSEGYAASLAGWTNLSLPEDVNGDGRVTTIDCLILINTLNSHQGAIELTGQPTGTYFPDVTQSGFVEPRDVLQIINYLNRRFGHVGGEAEADEVASADALSVEAWDRFELPLSEALPTETPERQLARSLAESARPQAADRVFADLADDRIIAVSELRAQKRTPEEPMEQPKQDWQDWGLELDLAVIAEDVVEAWNQRVR